jgi:3-isopropylmalate dehydrogenase
MFGDILSDLTAELSGSLGLGGSLNAGTRMPWRRRRMGPRPISRGRTSPTPFR